MKRLLLLALLTTPAFAGTTVTPGTWDVYSGTSRVASETTEAACIERGKAMKLAKFGCRTITTVIVTADPVPEPPVVVPPVIVPEPPVTPPVTPPPTGIADATNTGPLVKDLRAISGNQTISKGVLENFVLTGGQINVTGPDVVIRNFRIVGGMKVAYGIVATDARVKNLLIEHGEITGVTNIGIYGHDYTARRIYMHELGADGFRSTGNTVTEDSYVEKIGTPGKHADAVQVLTGSNIVYRRNHFYLPYNDPQWMNSAGFMIQKDKGAVDNVLLEDNHCIGGDFCLQLTGGVTNAVVRNNTFGRKGKEAEYGPYAENVRKSAVVLCGSRYTDGTLIDKACQ
jgi:hypothetical protein